MSDVKRQVKKAIQDSLGDILEEAYVAQAKKFSLRTTLRLTKRLGVL